MTSLLNGCAEIIAGVFMDGGHRNPRGLVNYSFDAAFSRRHSLVVHRQALASRRH